MQEKTEKKKEPKHTLLMVLVLVIVVMIVLSFIYLNVTVVSDSIMVENVDVLTLNANDFFRNNDFSYVLLSAMYDKEGVYFSEYIMSDDCWSCNVTNFPVKVAFNNTMIFNLQKGLGMIEPLKVNTTSYYPVEKGIIYFSDQSEKELVYNDSINNLHK